MAMLRMKQHRVQLPFVAQEQQPFAFRVKTPKRIDAFGKTKRRKRLMPRRARAKL
jgi:hypothetical protein